jgi:hypothetical protein
MFKAIDFWARRVIAWLLVLLGAGLNYCAGLLIFSGAWLMDREDILKQFREEN